MIHFIISHFFIVLTKLIPDCFPFLSYTFTAAANLDIIAIYNNIKETFFLKI